MSDIGELLADQLRVSGLYLPETRPDFASVPQRPFPSLKLLATRTIANNLHLWKSMPTFMPLELIQTLFDYCLKYRKVNNGNFALFAQYMSSYGSRLDISAYNTLRPQTLLPHLNPAAPAAIFSNLVEISFRRYIVTAKLLRAVLLATKSTLVSLDLYKAISAEFGDNDLLPVVPLMAHLTHIDIGGNRELTDKSLEPLATACTVLENLSINLSEASKGTAKAIRIHLRKLKRLDASYTSIGFYVTHLGSLNEPSPIEHLLSPDTSQPETYQRIFPNLKSLAISFPEPQLVEPLVSTLPHLMLSIISNEDWIPTTILAKCTALRRLQLRLLPPPDDWKVICTALAALTKLVVYSSGATEQHAQIIATTLTNLVCLRFKRYGELSSYSPDTQRLLLKNLSNLTELEATPFFYDTFPEMHQLAPQMKRLKYQNPQDIEGWPDREAPYEKGVFAVLPSLEKLSIDDRYSKYLHFKAPHLTKLMMHQNGDVVFPNRFIQAPLTRYASLRNLGRPDLDFISKNMNLIQRMELSNCDLNLEETDTDKKLEFSPVLANFRFLTYCRLSQVRCGEQPLILDDVVPMLAILDMYSCDFPEVVLSAKSLVKVSINNPLMKKLVIKSKALKELSLTLNLLNAAKCQFQTPNLSILRLTTTDDLNSCMNGTGVITKRPTYQSVQAGWDAMYKLLEKTAKNKLKTLDLSNFTHTKYSISLPNLVDFAVSSAAYYDDAPVLALKSLVVNCPNLEIININSSSFYHLEIANSPRLKEFHLYSEHVAPVDKLLTTINSTTAVMEYFDVQILRESMTVLGLKSFFAKQQGLTRFEVNCPNRLGDMLLAIEEADLKKLECCRFWKPSVREEDCALIDSTVPKLQAQGWAVSASGAGNAPVVPAAVHRNDDDSFPLTRLDRNIL